jgi:4-amino-4-deoxy-L-arabinose transferase-like glycosyltransferase
LKENFVFLRVLRGTSTPLLILLALNLVAGLLTYRDYGMSWDEPLFYNYADTIRAAYTPEAFTPGFDFAQVFGKSPEDHKIYGPAYLLLARPVQQAIMAVSGADPAAAWHLVNFLTFQLGLVAFYCLVRRWFDPWPAAAAAAFLAWQPVFWGHAFINPKDSPFMVFFLTALLLGFNWVDTLQSPSPYGRGARGEGIFRFFFAALLLGLTAAIRVIGPLAGVLVFIYYLLKRNWRTLPLFLAYGLTAVLVMFIFWPYLWADPVNRLLEVLKHMSNNPTELAVLFDGQIFRANEMPRRYLPQMFALTLTEPTWLLFLAGVFLAARAWVTRKLDGRAPFVLLGLFIFMLAYLLYNKPSVYDGFRHFLFLLPPVFVFIGFGFQWLWEKLKPALWGALIVLCLLPGLVGIVRLHPYEYAYYNLFAGGVGGAYRTYETEYWLTCYQEALAWTRANAPGATIHIQREFPLAEYYGQGLTLKDLGAETETDLRPGDLLLFHTRADLDLRSVYRKLPVEHVIGRDGAEFCLIKRKN